MSPLPRIPTLDTLGFRLLLGFAATAIALFMMVFYVRLLNDSVTRGVQSRYSQRTGDASPTVRRVASESNESLAILIAPR